MNPSTSWTRTIYKMWPRQKYCRSQQVSQSHTTTRNLLFTSECVEFTESQESLQQDLERNNQEREQVGQVRENRLKTCVQTTWTIVTNQSYFHFVFYKIHIQTWRKDDALAKQSLKYKSNSVLTTAASLKTIHKKVCLVFFIVGIHSRVQNSSI
jgi:hypothetical protein